MCNNCPNDKIYAKNLCQKSNKFDGTLNNESWRSQIVTPHIQRRRRGP